jgi:hypothetical protein
MFVGLALEAPINVWSTLFFIEMFVSLAPMAPTKVPKPYLSLETFVGLALEAPIKIWNTLFVNRNVCWLGH